MKKFLALICAAALLFSGCGGEETEEMSLEDFPTRVKAIKVLVTDAPLTFSYSGQVLSRMYQKYPSSERAIQSAYAYCTISASSVKWGFWGDDRGRGVAVNNNTGERIYVKMKEVSVGVNFGAKEYDLLFLIANKTAWDNFISGKIKFGSEVSAQASDGVSGGTFADATMVANGVWVYQLDKKGLAFELTLKGAKISPYKTLN